MIPVDPLRRDAYDHGALGRRERVVQPVVGQHQIAELKADVVSGVATEIANAGVIVVRDPHCERVSGLCERRISRQLALEAEERDVIFRVVDAIAEL